MPASAQHGNLRQYGIAIGVLQPGKWNAITDVPGVEVGQKTLVQGGDVRTGVTAILPHAGNIFQDKVPAAVYVGNGFGKLTGTTQIDELGNIETPIVLTNTPSVPTAADALIDYTFTFPENRDVGSVNPVVGETNDGYLNDIRGRHVTKRDVLDAIVSAMGGAVEQGNVGAGTGTVAFGFKGGIGTSSRKLPGKLGGCTMGVLVQTNFGACPAGCWCAKQANVERAADEGIGSGSRMSLPRRRFRKYRAEFGPPAWRHFAARWEDRTVPLKCRALCLLRLIMEMQVER